MGVRQAFMAFGAAAGMATSIQAYAQSNVATATPAEQGGDPAVQGGGVGEIVVTAQKRAQSINSVGLSIAAATGEQLQQRGVTDIADLGKLVPGFTFAPSPYATPVYTLRGVGLYESGFASSPAVTVYVDEVALPFPLMQQGATLDLERVEVLKGPQGTLFGQNSTGGAINYIAAKPTSTLTAGGSLSYERFGRMDATGYVSGPLTDTLNARVAARAVEGGAWQRSVSRPGDELGDQRQLYGRLLLDWQASDALAVTLNVNGWRDHSDTPAAQMFNITPATTAGAADQARAAAALAPSLYTGKSNRAADWTQDFPNRRRDDFRQVSLRGDLDVTDDIKLTSITSYQKMRADRYVDMDGSSAESLDDHITGSIENIGQELRLTGDTGPLNWILGANYDYTKSFEQTQLFIGDLSTNAPFAPAVPGFRIATPFTRQKIKNYAIFANTEYQLTPELSVIAGARYTDSRRKGTSCTVDVNDNQGLSAVYVALQELLLSVGAKNTPVVQIPRGSCISLTPGPDFSPALGGVNNTLNEDNLSWRFGLNYKVEGGALFYATASRGYKSGVITTISASSTGQYIPAKQERVDAYEVGFKAPLADRRVQLNGSAFYYDYRDKQLRGRLRDPVFNLLENLQNVPKSRIWGIEIDAQARPIEGLTVAANGTYLNSKVNDDFFTYAQGAEDVNDINNFRGSKLSYTPKWSGTFDAQYERPVNDSVSWFVGSTLTYQGKDTASLETEAAPYPDFRLPAYLLVDLRAGLSGPDQQWRLELFGRNITGERYVSTVFHGIDEVHRYMGRPTTYGARMSFKFN